MTEHSHQSGADTEQISSLKHQLVQARASAAKRYVHLKAVESLSQGTLGQLKEDQIYQLLCQTAVQQLKWDGAVVVEVHKNVCLRATFHLNQRQKRTLETDLTSIPDFLRVYAHQEALFTKDKDDAVSLALRTIFHTDEVAGAPIRFGDQLFGYLLVCAHTSRNTERDVEDLTFLKSIAALAAHAVENSRSLVDLEAQNVKLRQQDELKNSFISITSHQLRTPLSIVKWILSILEGDQEVKKLTEQHKLIEQAYVSNERLIHVVNDLLNVARIQEGKLPYAPQLTDLKVMIHELISGTEKLAENKKVTFHHSIEKEVPLLQLDPILFKEAIQNVLDNALDYNQEGGEVWFTLDSDDSFVRLVVTNTGMGVAELEQQAIFNQFYRSKDAVKVYPNGSGLGLYLSRAIVRQHGGDVTCVSEPGKETTFTISLPLTK
ncbi:MAG TPA: GAF domain-containing sensor histidine kinase [Verrucomicrobiae bacterium]|nr:GAF domain-containing sensor histidine kinase [Verrucomicrobiae bacterium]